MTSPTRSQVALPRAVESPPVPRAVLVGLGVLLSALGWFAVLVALISANGALSLAVVTAVVGLGALAVAVGTLARGLGDRASRGRRTTLAVLLVVGIGALVAVASG